MEHKLFVPQIKRADEGSALVVIATFGVVDKDMDVTRPGWFGEQYVQSVGAHEWRSVPIGKARIFELGNEALAEIKFNDTSVGQDWYKAIKFDKENPPARQEYSYGFQIREGGAQKGMLEGTPVRFLGSCPDGTPGCEAIEVSPVLKGAGFGTRTLDIKQEKDTPQEIMVIDAKQEGWTVQTLIFPRDKWDSAEDCQKWASNHDFSADGIETTESSFRIRQRAPGDFQRLRTICLAPNRETAPEDCRVQAVGGPMKEGPEHENQEEKGSFHDLCDETLGRVDHVIGLFEKFKGERQSEGRCLSTNHLERIRTFATRLETLQEVVKAGKADQAAASALFDRFQSLKRELTV